MKKSIFILTLIFLFFSCTNDENKEVENFKLTAKDLEFVGIEHNKVLDETLLFIKRENLDSDNSTNSKKMNLLKKFLVFRLASSDTNSKEVNDLNRKIIHDLFSVTDIAKKISFESLSKNANSENLSSIEIDFLNSLQNIINNNSFEEQDLTLQKINELEVIIQNTDNLSNDKLIKLFSATQTAKYSYIYWKENWREWVNLGTNVTMRCPNNCQTQERNKQHLKDVVIADGAGAVGGATVAAVTNVVPGAGQVAYGSAIITGAAGNSAIKAAEKLLSWLW